MSFENFFNSHSGQSLQDFNAQDLFGELGSVSQEIECLKDDSSEDEGVNKNVDEEGTGDGIITPNENMSLSLLQEHKLEEPTDLQELDWHSIPINRVNCRNLIDFAPEKMLVRKKKMRGGPTETKHLCKHLYTETKNYLKILEDIKLLPVEDQMALKDFISRKVCLQSFNELFLSPYLQEKCRQFFESSLFVRNILTTSMSMESKLNLVKYLQKMRKITCQRMIRWKD